MDALFVIIYSDNKTSFALQIKGPKIYAKFA